MKLVEVLDTGMGGAWPAMDFMDLRTTPAELKDFFRSDDGKLTSFFDYPDTCTQAVFAKVRDESDGVHLLLSCRGSTSPQDWATNAVSMKTRFEPQLDDIDGAGDPR